MKKRKGGLSRILRNFLPVNAMKKKPQLGKGGTVLRFRPEDQIQNLEPGAEVPTTEKTLYEAAPWEESRVLLNEYRVKGILGQGGMGTVYLVARLGSGRERFAVKTLLSSALEDEERNRLFMRELRTWIALPEHPHIVACRFFRTIEDRLAIFAEYVEGGTLKGWIRDRKLLSLEMILDVAIQCCWGLQAAHVHGVVHQDVKSANVLMTEDGIAKITDFGLARALHKGGMQKLASDRSGPVWVSAEGMTEAYCSPEQAVWRKLTHRTDIWSWGLAVLEMFTGSVTWSHGSIAKQALEECIKDGPEPPYLAMPDAVATVLRRCFQEKPAQRWNSLEEVAGVLREVYRQETGQIYPRQKPALAPRFDIEGMILERRTAKGAGWDDPRKWLARALRLSGRDPSELDDIVNERRGTRKEQALLDLDLYEQALNRYSDIAAQGMLDLETVLAHLMMNKAFVHEYLADVPGALVMHDRAIRLLDQLVKKEGRSELADALAWAYMSKGSAASALGDKRSAMALYDRAIGIRERLVKKEGRSELADGLAMVYMNKGVVLNALGDNRSAVELYGRAIRLLERLVNKEGRFDSANELARAYMNNANAFYALGDSRSAVKLYDQAIELFERLVNKEGRAELSNDLATAYINKGGVLNFLGDNRSASALYDKAIGIRERLVNKEGRSELANELSVVYTNKAVAVSALGDKSSALALYDKAIGIREHLVNKEGRSELANELAVVYMNKAVTVNALGDKPSAVALYDQAIQLLDRLVNEEGRLELSGNLATAYMNKANSLENDHLAVELYDRALHLLERSVKKKDRSDLLGDLAWIKTLKSASLFNLGEMQKAKKEVQAALPILQAEVKRTDRADLKNVLNLAEAVSNRLIK